MRFERWYVYQNEAGEDGSMDGGSSVSDADVSDDSSPADSGDSAAPDVDSGGDATAIPERPDYIPEKFWNQETGEARLEDILKSYTHLEKKLSGKNQAPESYELNVPEGVEVEIDTDNPMLASMTQVFKDIGLSQEAFDQAFGAYIESEAAVERAYIEQRNAEFAALGPNAQRRINDVSDWVKANFGEEQAQALIMRADSKAFIEALESFMELGRAPSLAPEDRSPDLAAEHEKLNADFMAVDEHGRRKMKDPAYAANFRKRAAAAGWRGVS